MLVVTQQEFPRLGASAAAFVERLGLPLFVKCVGAGVLHRYAYQGRVLTAAFDNDRAVAIHSPFSCSTPHLFDLKAEAARFGFAEDRAAELPWPSTSYRLLVADTGWMVAVPGCPATYLDAAAAPAQLQRGRLTA